MPLELDVYAPFILKCERLQKYKLFTNNQNNMGNFNYKEQHAVIVKCSSEGEQKKVFEKLKKLGFKDLKIVSV